MSVDLSKFCFPTLYDQSGFILIFISWIICTSRRVAFFSSSMWNSLVFDALDELFYHMYGLVFALLQTGLTTFRPWQWYMNTMPTDWFYWESLSCYSNTLLFFIHWSLKRKKKYSSTTFHSTDTYPCQVNAVAKKKTSHVSTSYLNKIEKKKNSEQQQKKIITSAELFPFKSNHSIY